MKLLILLLAGALLAEDKPKPAEPPRLTELEALRMENLSMKMANLEKAYAELVKVRAIFMADICKRAGIEGCEIRPDGVIAKRDTKPEAKK